MQHDKSKFIRTSNHNIFVFNAILWCFSFIVLLYFFSQDDAPSKIDYIYTASFIATIIIPVCINLYLLIPNFLKKEKYLLFCFLFILNLVLFTQLNNWFFNSLIDALFSDYYFISYHSNVKIFFIFSIFLVATTLIKLSEDWLYLNQLENETLKLEKEHIETQLSSLKAQINPHFLFNSLNVLYALALKDSKKTTDAIVQLSDILRYVLYHSNTQKITFKKEIDLLYKYLDFQKFRYNEKATVQIELNIDTDDFDIYPMLLLPLVENSFKHGIKGDTEKTFINIRLYKTKNEFHFFIENNLSDEIKNETKKYSGLGLKNIQQNLDLIYPGQHSFIVSNTATTFQVSLKIKINEH